MGSAVPDYSETVWCCSKLFYAARPKGRFSVNAAKNVLRPAVGSRHLAIHKTPAELGGDYHLVAFAFQRAPQQLFILEWAVSFGGIKQSDAEFDRAVDGRDRLLVVRCSIRLAHSEAAETYGRDLKSLLPEPAPYQHASPPITGQPPSSAKILCRPFLDKTTARIPGP